jgi:hypothetical protein
VTEIQFRDYIFMMMLFKTAIPCTVVRSGDLSANFAQARTASRESGLAERLVATLQLPRSVALFS